MKHMLLLICSLFLLQGCGSEQAFDPDINLFLNSFHSGDKSFVLNHITDDFTFEQKGIKRSMESIDIFMEQISKFISDGNSQSIIHTESFTDIASVHYADPKIEAYKRNERITEKIQSNIGILCVTRLVMGDKTRDRIFIFIFKKTNSGYKLYYMDE